MPALHRIRHAFPIHRAAPPAAPRVPAQHVMRRVVLTSIARGQEHDADDGGRRNAARQTLRARGPDGDGAENGNGALQKKQH